MQSVGRVDFEIIYQEAASSVPFFSTYTDFSLALVPKCNCSLNWYRREESHMSIPVALHERMDTSALWNAL